MSHRTSLSVRFALLIALLAVSSASQAAFTVFTSRAAFLGAVTAPGVDSFTGLSTIAATNSPITRSAGPYAYTATSTTSFFGAGSAANPALSTNVDTDVITFSSFSGAASAIGGLFFGSDITGSFVSAMVVLTATDSLGATSTRTMLAAPDSFIGFVSTGTLVSLVVNTSMPGEFIFPTVDELTIATTGAAPIPEPQTWALFAASLGVLGFCARRKRLQAS